MMRKIIAIAAGLAVWLLIAVIAGFVIRMTWPEYVSVAAAMAFTLPMKIARLAIGAVATMAAGIVTARITQSAVASLMPGIILLIAFIPEHVMLWEKFPIWYHAWFLGTLLPFTYLGNSIGRGRIRQRSIVATT
jgi:hypothetical protein